MNHINYDLSKNESINIKLKVEQIQFIKGLLKLFCDNISEEKKQVNDERYLITLNEALTDTNKILDSLNNDNGLKSE